MRVLVISGASGFATIAETGGHDVIEARLGDARAWQQPDDIPVADVVLIDIPDLALATHVVETASRVDPQPASVLIEGAGEEWRSHALAADVSLQPPLSRDTVLAAIDVARSRKYPDTAVDDREPSEVEPSDVGPSDVEPAPPLPSRPVSPPSPPPPPARASDGVRRDALALAGACDEIPTVAEIASTLAATAAEELRAEAAAVLCADQENWSVVGGYGTRSLELRVSLPPEHWLIENLVSQRRGALIDRSDIVRSELTNAPLASRDHLVIVCDHECESVLMVGRDGEPFTQADLHQAHSLLRQASPFILDALALHELATSLERFRDLR